MRFGMSRCFANRMRKARNERDSTSSRMGIPVDRGQNAVKKYMIYISTREFQGNVLDNNI